MSARATHRQSTTDEGIQDMTASDELNALKERIAALEGKTQPAAQGSQLVGAGRSGTLNDAPPTGETDQMLANEIVGFDEIEKPSAEDRKAKADLLARLSDERRQRVEALAEETRAIRRDIENPTPRAYMVKHWSGLTTTETYRYLTRDGRTREKVVESGTGKVLRDDTIANDPIVTPSRSPRKPAPAATVTKGRTMPKTH
jgi:hypothetical protein